MNKCLSLIKYSFLISLALSLIDCNIETNKSGTESSKTGSEKAKTYTNPFDYCRAVGNIDSPDSMYVGPKVPEVIVHGLQKAFGGPSGAPLEVFERGTYWRCMDGKVYACNIGANLPCGEKADTSRKASQAMREFCKSNSDSDYIPAYITGHATIYQWRCTGNEPAIVKQIAKPDASGYISNIWYEISPM